MCFLHFTYNSTTVIYSLSLHDALPIYDLVWCERAGPERALQQLQAVDRLRAARQPTVVAAGQFQLGHRVGQREHHAGRDRKSTRLNSSHVSKSYAVFCLKKKTNKHYSS